MSLKEKEKLPFLRSPDLHRWHEKGFALCHEWMHGRCGMEQALRSWTCAMWKVRQGGLTLSGCALKLHLDSESFLLLGSSPSENAMGKGMSLTSREVTLGSLSFPLSPGAKLS